MGAADESDSQPGVPPGARAPRLDAAGVPVGASPEARRLFNIAGILSALATEYREAACRLDTYEGAARDAELRALDIDTLETARGLTELAADGAAGRPPPVNGTTPP